MGIASPQTLRDAAALRIPEGWQTCRLSKAKHIFMRDKGDRIILTWQHPDSGAELDHFLNVNDPTNKQYASSRRDIQILSKLAEYNNLNWPDDANGDTVAKLIEENVSAMDLQIQWGKGDGTFVGDVALAGEAPHVEEPQTEVKAEAPARRKVDF